MSTKTSDRTLLCPSCGTKDVKHLVYASFAPYMQYMCDTCAATFTVYEKAEVCVEPEQHGTPEKKFMR